MTFTIKTIHQNLAAFLNLNSVLKSTLSEFGRLKSDYERERKAFLLLKEAELLPSFNRDEEKCPSLSKKHRVRGNEAFFNKLEIIAIEEYTQAIGYAPCDSEELALAYANRSAVTYFLGEHLNCIKDIEMALSLDYPDSLRYKLLERKGKSLMQLCRYKEAEESLGSALHYLQMSTLSMDKQTEVEKGLNNLLHTCSLTRKPANEIALEPKCILPEFEKPNETIESASAKIDISFSEEMGRHIVSTEQINPGDVLAIEKPFASVLLPSYYTTHCTFCLKRCHTMKPCPHCNRAFFCSEKCLKMGSDLFHRIECTLLPALLQLGCHKMELLAVRILLIATKQGTQMSELSSNLKNIETVKNPKEKGRINGNYFSSNYSSAHLLEGNTHLRTPDDLLERSVTAVCMVEAIKKSSDFFIIANETKGSKEQSFSLNGKSPELYFKNIAGGLLLRYLQSIVCNAHEVSEMSIVNNGSEVEACSIEIGSALYPLLSLTNHSCDPNVVRHSYCGDTVVLTAIQVIKAGEQIFDNYGYHHAVHDLQTRRHHLIKQYHFKCKCIACNEDWPPYASLPDKTPVFFSGANRDDVEKSSKMFTKHLAEIVAGNVSNKLPFLYSHLLLLHKTIRRPWKEYSECQEAIKQCLSLQANHFIQNRGRKFQS